MGGVSIILYDWFSVQTGWRGRGSRWRAKVEFDMALYFVLGNGGQTDSKGNSWDEIEGKRTRLAKVHTMNCLVSLIGLSCLVCGCRRLEGGRDL